eukprot:scaffold2097_cov403-Prasinococcus_capsulatus_cf.AAC.15
MFYQPPRHLSHLQCDGSLVTGGSWRMCRREVPYNPRQTCSLAVRNNARARVLYTHRAQAFPRQSIRSFRDGEDGCVRSERWSSVTFELSLSAAPGWTRSAWDVLVDAGRLDARLKDLCRAILDASSAELNLILGPAVDGTEVCL